MRPTQHESNNDVLRAPPGIDIDACRPLAITRVLYGGDTPGVISYWQPSAEELALLNAGRPVYISCWGSTHPPIAIGVDGDGNLS